MIGPLATAIKSAYDAAGGATLRAANTGGLWFTQAPQAVSEPYTVFLWVGSAIDDQMGGATARIERCEIQFSVFSRAEDGGSEAADIATKLMSWFDESSLTVTGHSHIRNERNGTSGVLSVDDVYMIVINYTIWVSWS